MTGALKWDSIRALNTTYHFLQNLSSHRSGDTGSFSHGITRGSGKIRRGRLPTPYFAISFHISGMYMNFMNARYGTGPGYSSAGLPAW